MKIELKNVKVNMYFSRETNNFVADIYVDGVKVGYAENDGCGGCTYYNSYPNKRDVLREAETYLLTLPSTYYPEYDLTLESNMEHFIDNEIDKIILKKETERLQKKLQKDMLKGLCYGSSTSYSLVTWKNYTFEQLLKTPVGQKAIENKVKELVERGETVLNTNIPQNILNNVNSFVQTK